MRPRFVSLLVLLLVACSVSATAGAAVVVNGVALDRDTRQALERAYGLRVPDGAYWYDRVSGLWGLEGGPSAGLMHPGLPLGGTLRANASGGHTNVYVNGRSIHPAELRSLQQIFGTVIPGRYWLAANGVGGFEGAPPSFNLAQAGGGGGRRGSLLSGYFLTGVSVLGN